MLSNEMPLPSKTTRFRQHPVATPGRAEALLEMLPDQSEVLERMEGHHLLSAWHLDRDLVMALFRQAAEYEIKPRPHKSILGGRIVVNAFVDGVVNTTRVSFQSAAYSLGASVMDFDRVPTGREDDVGAMTELAEMLNSYGDVVVLRTGNAQGFDAVVRDATIPVINGGNGEDENPSQALVDLYTLFKWRPELMFPDVDESKKLQIGFFGAPAHTRTSHSLLALMSLFPWAFSRVLIFGRENQLFRPGQREKLEATGLKIETTGELYRHETMVWCLEHELPQMDVIYADLLKPLDLSHIVRQQAVESLKPEAMVLAPAMHFKEFGALMDDSTHNAYFTQARSAVYMRMAVLQAILGQ